MKNVARLAVTLLACLLVLVPTRPAAAQAAVYTSAETGYSVADSAQGRFLSEFRRFGGVDALGYPVSQPFTTGGFTYQTFQRAVLQWRPEVNQAYLANALDWLSDAGKDPFLASLGVPPPLPDAGGSWQQIIAEREEWLTEPSIAQAYRRGGGYNRYGLPASRPQHQGPFVVQRFQRYVFQLWLEAVPGMPPVGSVVGVLVGDLLKQTGLVPSTPAPGSTAGAVSVACASNPQSVIKSTDVDVVRYRFVSLGPDKTGLELTLRNNCDEPRQIKLRVRASASAGAAPVAVGPEREGDFAAFEERQVVYSWENADGTYPRVDPAYSLTFRWNWQREGDSSPACVDVGAERCLTIDPWLRSTVQDLSANPTGAALLREAAQNRVVVRRGDLAPNTLGVYYRPSHAVTLTNRLDAYGEFERATVLAHELRHAADQVEGIAINSTQTCLASEERAFRVSTDVWYWFWGGNLPQAPANSLPGRLNQIAVAAHTSSAALGEAVLALYGDVCH